MGIIIIYEVNDDIANNGDIDNNDHDNDGNDNNSDHDNDGNDKWWYYQWLEQEQSLSTSTSPW